MSQSRNPVAIRLGEFKNWKSSWFNPSWEPTIYNDNLIRDYIIGAFLKKKITIGDISIKRKNQEIIINIFTEKTRNIDKSLTIKYRSQFCYDLRKLIGTQLCRLNVNLILFPSIDSKRRRKNSLTWDSTYLINYIVKNLKQRKKIKYILQSFDRFIRKNSNAGYKLRISGRLTAASRAKSYVFLAGKVPIGKLDKKIDYSNTTIIKPSGTVGIKLWISR